MCRNFLHMGTVFYLWKLKRNFFIWMYTYIVNWKYIQTDVHKRHSHHPSSNDVPVKNDFYYILLYFSKRLFIQVDTYNILLYYLSYIPPYIKTLFFVYCENCDTLDYKVKALGGVLVKSEKFSFLLSMIV